MKEIDILPGDKVELRLICRVKEVQLTDNDGYFLTLIGEEGPHQGGTISIDMSKAGNYVKKLNYDAILGDYT